MAQAGGACEQLQVGAAVVLTGLVATPQLNGAQGEVSSPAVPGADPPRWHVRLLAPPSVVAEFPEGVRAKAENMVVLRRDNAPAPAPAVAAAAQAHGLVKQEPAAAVIQEATQQPVGVKAEVKQESSAPGGATGPVPPAAVAPPAAVPEAAAEGGGDGSDGEGEGDGEGDGSETPSQATKKKKKKKGRGRGGKGAAAAAAAAAAGTAAGAGAAQPPPTPAAAAGSGGGGRPARGGPVLDLATRTALVRQVVQTFDEALIADMYPAEAIERVFGVCMDTSGRSSGMDLRAWASGALVFGAWITVKRWWVEDRRHQRREAAMEVDERDDHGAQEEQAWARERAWLRELAQEWRRELEQQLLGGSLPDWFAGQLAALQAGGRASGYNHELMRRRLQGVTWDTQLLDRFAGR
ncbi:hypothetical protein CHLRE_06g311100v5 [Chlamydomonas reinhardtii]|uniref:Uncharacterized protein n=1 Tax=Chlamydomonas reinhardtii TaxID=3055 RepID=A0A2K3DRP1_CHLRE|nr:uncharacterized protein CHLRE_06g311100v5 [Chlamydomonas reinhardtii]PNW83206.1 hypothetical protein CHLRE_06g311100v5 [Chlamydomonas reinhardtii]